MTDETPLDQPQTPYGEGYAAAARPRAKCPYPFGTPEYNPWWDGYCDGTDDLIHWSDEA